MRLRACLLTLTILTPMAALCDEPPPDDVWTGKGQAGFVSSQGNTQAQSANAALDAALQDGAWKHALHLGGLYGKSAGIVSSERWDTGWQTDYNLNANLFTFGALRYAHDMFSGFQYQETATAGIGDKFIDTEATKLSGQAGVGYRRLRPELLTRDASGAVVARTPEASTTGVIFTAGMTYSQNLTSTTTLSDKLLIESGSTDTLVTNALALTVKVSTRLALSLGYNLQDNTKPPAGLKKLDSLETVNLVYAF